MLIDIVVASYNEDLSWLTPLARRENRRLYVYTTGSPRNPPPDLMIPVLENRRREAGQWVQHMVLNHGNHGDQVVFLQGNPEEQTVIDLLHQNTALQGTFTPMPPTQMLEFGQWNPSGSYVHDQAAWDFCQRFHGWVPPRTEWSVGAQFAVMGAVLNQRPLSYYKRLLDHINADPISPWACERLWRVLVGDRVPPSQRGFGPTVEKSDVLVCSVFESHISTMLADQFTASLKAVEPNVPTMHIDALRAKPSEEARLDFEGDRWLDLQKFKYQRVLDTLTPSYDGKLVIWSDVDIKFYEPFVDDIASRMEGVDVLFQREVPLDNIPNCGFMAMRPSQATFNFFKAVSESDLGPGCNDQDVVVKLLRAKSPPIRWGLLPFTYAAKSHGWEPPMLHTMKLFHANATRGPGSVKRKEAMFETLGYLK